MRCLLNNDSSGECTGCPRLNVINSTNSVPGFREDGESIPTINTLLNEEVFEDSDNAL